MQCQGFLSHALDSFKNIEIKLYNIINSVHFYTLSILIILKNIFYNIDFMI